MTRKIAYVGIDYHIKTLTVAVMIEGEKQFADTVHMANQDKLIKRYLNKLSRKYSVKACYEASASGYVFQRKMKRWGFHCDVIAPSLIPQSAADRRKNDFRDARKLARNYAKDDLVVVHPPTEAQESVRSLIRCRLQFKEAQKVTKQQINSFLLSRGLRWERSKWTRAHLRWLATLEIEDLHAKCVFTEQLNLLKYLQARIDYLDDQIEQIAQSDIYRSSVLKLKAFRGIDTLSAMLLIAEITDFRRFATAGALMAFLGLVPSENSTGDRHKGGPITKAGNRRIRTQLVEAATHFSKKPHISSYMQKNLQATDARSARIAVKCMQRLHKRYWTLLMKGKERNKVIAATAREFAGFIWAMMQPEPQVV